MANANRLNGFTPVGYLNGADWDGRGRVYAIPAANTNAIFVGDPVKLIAGADPTFFLPCIDKGTAGATAVGVVIGIQKFIQNVRGGQGPWVDPTNLNTIVFRPAPAQTVPFYALVVDDPNVIFEAQEQTTGGAGTNFIQTAASKNADFGINVPGQPPFYSAAFIDNLGTGTPPNAATSNLKLLGLKQSIDNAPGAFQRWWCILNNHAYRAGVVGV